MSDSEILLNEVSPYGNVEAVVEQDERVAYFYLHGANGTDFGVRSCWVRNLGSAPEALDVEGMRNGIPPMLPRVACAHPSGAQKLESSNLKIVWFEEGDAATLLNRESVLTVISGWSGYKGFPGYSRDCVEETEVAWPLGTPSSNALFARIDSAKDFWEFWSTENSPWPDIQSRFLDAYENQIGAHSNYYAIDDGKWPPKAMLRIPQNGSTAFVTIGVSIRAQPQTDPGEENPERPRRIELGACLANHLEEPVLQEFAKYISGQSGFPWSHFTYLGEHHTIPCDAFRRVDLSSPITAVLLLSEPGDAPVLSLPDVSGESVRLLWMVPITEEERQLAINQGSKKLVESIESNGRGWVYRSTKSKIEVQGAQQLRQRGFVNTLRALTNRFR